MPFNSFNFWLIFPIIFVVYWVIPSKYNKARNFWLILVSYLLYMNWKPSFAIVLFGVTCVTYFGGLLVKDGNNKKLGIAFSILGLLPLLVFKYYNFLNESIYSFLGLLGLRFSLPGLNWAVPVGISFFTFQAVGYLLDVYHNKVKAEENLFDYILFVSFFPEIASGPISRGDELLPQIKNPHTFKYEQGRDGLKLLLWGMFMKLAVADRIGIYVDTVYTNYIHYSGATCLFAAAMYSIQIYCDFGGYSYMAIGIAKTLGFDLTENFRRPYFAASVTEFWRRWHITLTRWLTRHVYIALGGNRCSKFRQYLNIVITFLVSGIWHGANWTFIVWGLLHGFVQIIEKMIFGDRLKIELGGGKPLTFRFLRVFVTFFIVTIAWIFFRMPTIGDASGFISKIFTDFGSYTLDPLDIISVLSLGVCLPILFLKSFKEEYPQYLKIADAVWFKWGFYILVSVLVLIVGVLDCGQFIYVNF